MNIAVIFAGGTGKRMIGSSRPKQFLEIHEKPIIIHTLELFSNHDEIDGIVIACLEEWILYLEELIRKYRIQKVIKIVKGGKSGQMSIYNGLVAAEEYAKAKNDNNAVVLIHDGVRPLINERVISDNISSVRKNGSAITSSAVTETIMVVKNDGGIEYVADRDNSKIAKAPQSFLLSEILEVHRQAQSDGIYEAIDSCTLMKKYEKDLFWIEGPQNNIKITTPEDFYLMRAILDAKENVQIYLDE